MIPLVVYGLPTCFKNTILGITVSIYRLIKEYTCVNSLTDINTVLTKVIIVSVNQLNTGKFFAFNIICKAAVFNYPAILNSLRKGKCIVKLSICITKVTTGILTVIRINIRKNIILFLIFRLLSKTIERACTHINIITYLTGINSSNAVLSTPISISFRSKFYSVYHTKRISTSLIDSLCLVNPIHGYSNSIGSSIKFCIA